MKKFLIFTIFIFSIVGCIDRGNPVFKEIANGAGNRETESTEKLISQSSELQNLEKICRDLPFFRGTQPKIKGISRENDVLFYYYNLETDVKKMQEALKEQLSQNGWVLKKENNGIWENQIEFEKGNYWIQVTNGNFGESNYGTNCKDSTIAD